MNEQRYANRKRIGVITQSEKSWSKEFSIIQWRNNDKEMFDIRKWKYDNDGEIIGKGISLNRSELIKLKGYIDKVLGQEDDFPLDVD